MHIQNNIHPQYSHTHHTPLHLKAPHSQFHSIQHAFNHILHSYPDAIHSYSHITLTTKNIPNQHYQKLYILKNNHIQVHTHIKQLNHNIFQYQFHIQITRS